MSRGGGNLNFQKESGRTSLRIKEGREENK
jgi:hypothetical protein